MAYFCYPLSCSVFHLKKCTIVDMIDRPMASIYEEIENRLGRDMYRRYHNVGTLANSLSVVGQVVMCCYSLSYYYFFMAYYHIASCDINTVGPWPGLYELHWCHTYMKHVLM